MLEQLEFIPPRPARKPWTAPAFGGATYEPEKDAARLSGQLARVRECMADGEWRTLREIKGWCEMHHATPDSEPGISARLRDLRKPRFGAHEVKRRRRAGGLYEYRLIPRED